MQFVITNMDNTTFIRDGESQNDPFYNLTEGSTLEPYQPPNVQDYYFDQSLHSSFDEPSDTSPGLSQPSQDSFFRISPEGFVSGLSTVPEPLIQTHQEFQDLQAAHALMVQTPLETYSVAESQPQQDDFQTGTDLDTSDASPFEPTWGSYFPLSDPNPFLEVMSVSGQVDEEDPPVSNVTTQGNAEEGYEHEWFNHGLPGCVEDASPFDPWPSLLVPQQSSAYSSDPSYDFSTAPVPTTPVLGLNHASAQFWSAFSAASGSVTHDHTSPQSPSGESTPRASMQEQRSSYNLGMDGTSEGRSSQSAQFTWPPGGSLQDMDEEMNGEEDEEDKQGAADEEGSEGAAGETEDEGMDENWDDDNEFDNTSPIPSSPIIHYPEIRQLTTLYTLNHATLVAKGQLQDFVRVPYNILASNTEQNFYALANELWAEADDPDVPEKSVVYYQAEGDAAEQMGMKLGLWVERAAREYVKASRMSDTLCRGMRAAESIVGAYKDNAGQTVLLPKSLLTHINDANAALQLQLRRFDRLRLAMRSLNVEMKAHPEFKNVMPATDSLHDIDSILARVEDHKPFRVERILNYYPRLSPEDVKDEACVLCQEKPFVGRGRRRETSEEDDTEIQGDAVEGAMTRLVNSEGGEGEVVDLECLRAWLHTSSSCPITRKRLY